MKPFAKLKGKILPVETYVQEGIGRWVAFPRFFVSCSVGDQLSTPCPVLLAQKHQYVTPTGVALS